MSDHERPTLHQWRRAILATSGPRLALSRLVALALAQDMSSQTLETFVGAERLAAVTGLSERAVRTHLANLVAQGWLTEKTASRGQQHWRKVRRAAFPDVAAVHAGSSRIEVPVAHAGTSEVAALNAGTSVFAQEVPAGGDRSGGKPLQEVPAEVHALRAVDLGDLGEKDLERDQGAGGFREISIPRSKSPRGRAGERRNGTFEAINTAVLGLVRRGASAHDVENLARCAAISVSQAAASLAQLRERGDIQ